MLKICYNKKKVIVGVNMKKPLNNCITIRRMAERDVGSVAQIEVECFLHPWSEAALAAELGKPRCDFFVAELEGEIAGYIGTYITLDECSVANVAVSCRFRRLGIGRSLVEHALKNAADNACSAIYLEVRQSNLPAISLYSSLGFEKLAVRKRFYTEPDEDALVMSRSL